MRHAPAPATRQAFPRWHLVQAAEPEPAPRHTARVIPFAGARGPAVVTYPRALVMRRARPCVATERPAVLGWRIRALAATALAGTVAAILL